MRRVPSALHQAQRRNRLEKRAKLIGAGLLEPQRGKYRNVKAEYRGMKFDSMGEAEYAAKLDMLVKAGEVVDWEQPKPVVLVDGPKARDRITMIPDFYVIPAVGNSFYVDYKGSRVTETPAFKLKVKLWRRHVGHELRVVYADGTEKVVATGNECYA